jgi:hypothetical protein
MPPAARIGFSVLDGREREPALALKRHYDREEQNSEDVPAGRIISLRSPKGQRNERARGSESWRNNGRKVDVSIHFISHTDFVE